MYVSKLSEYAHSVAGQGRQHVGSPGIPFMGAQKRPSTTLESQQYPFPPHVVVTYIPRLMEILMSPGKVPCSRLGGMILIGSPF